MVEELEAGTDLGPADNSEDSRVQLKDLADRVRSPEQAAELERGKQRRWAACGCGSCVATPDAPILARPRPHPGRYLGPLAAQVNGDYVDDPWEIHCPNGASEEERMSNAFLRHRFSGDMDMMGGPGHGGQGREASGAN